MRLQGCHAVVTGGVRGIGRAVVERLLARGVEVAVFDKDESGLQELTLARPEVHGFEVYLTDPEAVAQATERARAVLERIEILVNNAGLIHSAPLFALSAAGLKSHPLEEWRRIMAANLEVTFNATISVVRTMLAGRTRGVVVNMSSISARGKAGQSAYAAAKAGIEAATSSWAKELAPWGVRVVAIAPGFIETAATHEALSPSALAETVKSVPLRRLGSPEEVAEAVLFAAENDFVTGVTLHIDGGLVV